ncbi:MAG: hypothetical protein ACRDRS_23115 [Pseudonocardiaceae bacterium]
MPCSTTSGNVVHPGRRVGVLGVPAVPALAGAESPAQYGAVERPDRLARLWRSF